MDENKLRKKVKLLAKSQLRGRWGGIVIAMLFTSIIITGPQVIIDIFTLNNNDNANLTVSIMMILLDGAIMLGISIYTLKFIRGKAEFKDILSGFKNYFKAIGLYFLQVIIITIGLILLIVPGIIFAIKMSQAGFILADDGSKGIIQCLKESWSMMSGRTGEYFILELSFLGWLILSILTFGIGMIFLVPYMNITFGNYYESIKLKL